MTDNELITRLLRDLTSKVDELPDRHELNAIVERLDGRITISDEKIRALKDDTEELKRGRLPWTVLAQIGTIASAFIASVALFVALNHPSATSQAAIAPASQPPIIQPIGKHP